MSSEQKPTYTVCLYHEGLAEPFDKFRQVFWPRAQPVTKKISDAPSSTTHSPPTFLFLKNSEVLGHISSLPVEVWCEGKRIPAHWVVGFMVLPEYRGGPVGVSIIKKVNEALALPMTLTVEQAPLRIFKGLGWAHPGTLPQYVFLLRPGEILANLSLGAIEGGSKQEGSVKRLALRVLQSGWGKALASGLCRVLFRCLAWRTVLSPWSGSYLAVTEEEGFLDEYDELWERMKPRYQALVVRDRAYLSARYGSRRDKYRLLVCRQEGRIEGFFVVSVKQFHEDGRMGNSKVGTVIDCLLDPGRRDIFSRLLSFMMTCFKKEGVDAVLCTASLAQIGALLRGHGFVRIPGNLKFVFRDNTQTIPSHLPLDAWHLMRGDCDADQNF